ncbi:MAG: histidine phosphatase family protein [Rhodobacteraceae bacterium]|nr:histidine phosphatase family protein [Paracoccaceae bacterium]
MLLKKPFYYIRHGQTDWNLEKRYQGSKDIPLNEAGIAQAHSAVDSLKNCGITHIFSSPLVRARATADILNKDLNLPLTEIVGLQECNFGVLEGTLRSGKSFSDKWRAGYTPDQAETYDAFTQRVFAAFEQVLCHDSVPLVVAHGAVFWPIHEHTGLTLQGTLPNATAIRVFPSKTADSGWDFS